MKKYIKYLSSFLLMFVALISSVSAVTIKETLIEGDGYSTIEDGSIVIGVTKFHSDVVVTGGRATKAGSDAAVIHLKLNGNLDDFETPVIYVYAGGAWFALDKNNDASVVEDQAILDDLSNKDIYYVNDDEKLLDIDVSGINIDTSKLPKGVTYKDGKIWVKATKDTVTVLDKNGAEYKFVKDRGLWGLDQSECYEVNGREIIGYSNTCSKDVIVPSKVGDTEIVSVGADAFRNKGIKTVIIPSHITSLKDNAFADNSLESVTIEDKYDEADFDYYGNNVFGNFKDTDIVWKNELTVLLDKFDDEVEIKVSDTFKEHKFEYDEDKYSVYPSYVKQQQINKLGLNVDEVERINGKYYVIFGINEDEEDKMYLSISDEEHYAEKEITFNIINVNEKNDDYKNIKIDYEKYFETIKAKMKKKDFSSKLTGIDGLIDIADKYNYEVITMSNGFGDGPMDYSGEPEKANKYLIYNGTLHYVYEDMPFYSSIFFPVAIDGELKESEEIFAAMKEEFEKETNIADYNVFYTDSYGNVDKYEYVINLDVEEMDEVFVLYYSIVPEKGKLYLNYEEAYANSYTYYPKKSLNDFNGYVQQYFENAYDELIDTYNVEIDNISISSWVDYSSEVNEDGLYDAIYHAEGTIYNNEDNKYYYYNVSVNNQKPTKTKDIFVESFAEFDNNKAEEEYEQDVLGVFLEKTKLDNIYISYDNIYKFKYDENKGKYEVYGAEAEGKGILDGYYIFDFNTNARYIALFKNFYDREPGTLFKTSTDINDGDFVYNYKYIPLTKYNGGKVSDYVNTLKQELKEKANLDDDSYISFGHSGSTCNGSNECSTTYSLVSYVDGIDSSYRYSVEFDVATDSSYEWEYLHTSTVNPEDYNYDLYEQMIYSECINGLGLTDYYITNSTYSYGEEYNKYELYDFANNRRIMIIAKRYALG